MASLLCMLNDLIWTQIINSKTFIKNVFNRKHIWFLQLEIKAGIETSVNVF